MIKKERKEEKRKRVLRCVKRSNRKNKAPHLFKKVKMLERGEK